MAITRFSLLGLLVATASAVCSAQDIGNSSALSSMSVVNATTRSNWTETQANSSAVVLARLNATIFNSSTNASSTVLSSPVFTAAIADFVRNVLDQLNALGLSGAGLGNSTESTSSVMTDLLTQLLHGEGAEEYRGSVNLSSFSAPLNASINATTLALAAINSIDSLRDTSEDITFESLKHPDTNDEQSSSLDGSGSMQAYKPIALEHAATDNSQARVVSHVLASAVEEALAEVAETARESATQFQTIPKQPSPAVVTASAFSVATETTSAGSASTAFEAWLPTIAAVGAVVVLVGAALFGYQNRRQQRYNTLSPGSLRLAQLTPPRELA